MTDLEVPQNLRCAAQDEDRLDWVEELPAVIDGAAARWQLTVGPPYQPGGACAWVAPAESEEHGTVVLKVGWPHPDATHEAAGLALWDGRGAVRLLASARTDRADLLLLERCVPGSALAERPGEEQDVVVAGLLRELWREPPADHDLPSLRTMCERWAHTRAQRPPGDLDPGLVREGIALFRSLPADAGRAVLLTTDLHAQNVLASERRPWLAIDPKPHVGDPAYDVLQHLLNRDEELRRDPEVLARRLAGLTEVDPERVLLWLFARCVIESHQWPSLADVARRVAPR